LALDLEFRNAVGEEAPLSVVFSHPVYQYFQKRYVISGPSVHWEPGELPPDGEWARVEAAIEKGGATAMIWEGEPVDAISRRLADLGLPVVVIDPCSNTPANGDFLAVMRRNAAALRSAAGASSRKPTRTKS
jgi:zinc transport system substrate-binding protein